MEAGKRVVEAPKKRGCIKVGRGPWLVKRERPDGEMKTSWRWPSPTEREKNLQRERRRRAVARNIFAGLKKHGNYRLPKHADQNDLLKALCEEAGWHVEDDGTVYRKSLIEGPSNTCTTNEMSDCRMEMNKEMDEDDLKLTLSFRYM